MNIVELSDKNLCDAIALYKFATKDYLNLTDQKDFSDEKIGNFLMQSVNDSGFTYLFYDKSVVIAMVTINKNSAEIENMFINYNLIDSYFSEKFLEFVIKQFSAISRVFVWVVSIDSKAIDMIEGYGFEYTGEQQYISKEDNVLRFRYLFRRKK